MTNLGNPISATRPWPNFVTSKPSPAPLEPYFTGVIRKLLLGLSEKHKNMRKGGRHWKK